MIRILLIEDDRDHALLVREALSQSLKDVEFTVVETGEQALSMDFAAYQVILLDNNLPDMTGLEILEKISSIEHSPVIMVTGDDHIATAVQALKRGAEDFVIKSLNLDQLLPHVVERAIANDQQRKLMSEIEIREREKKVQIETLKRIMMTLAHHLNNAIMPITFSAELCQRNNYKIETTERLVATCIRETQRITAIIERFEQYAESEEFKYADYLDLKNAMFEV